MTKAPEKVDPSVTEGFVMTNLREGSLLVRNAAGKTIRLAWEPLGEGERKRPAGEFDRWRALPPGEYTLTGYRVVQEDANGVGWFVSALAPKGIRNFTVASRSAQKIEIDPSIQIDPKLNMEDGVMVQVPITGQNGAGLSIYRKGARIPIGYLLTDADGKRLDSGEMTYG